jgi:hypothetical protein
MRKRKTESGTDWELEWTGPSTVDIKCRSWNGFIDFLHHDRALKQKQGYIFRGHASSEWALVPTLKRAFNSDKPPWENLKKEEEKTLNAFKKYCLGRRGHNPPQLGENEWWALGQHFGLNTPLLDWSESPYVAAFFAFNSNELKSDNAVIWVLNKGVNNKPCIEKLKEERHIEFLTPYLDENSRLINQRGLFVRTPEMICLTKWVKQISEEGVIDLARVFIPSTEQEFALDSLDKMNINELTLFPDLLGAAKYANYVANRKKGKIETSA